MGVGSWELGVKTNSQLLVKNLTKAYYITAEELASCGVDNIPSQLRSDRHLVYSSPATLAFNSPGAQGFGVKRAGLAVPESVMLLVAPRCCGRNTAALGHEQSLADRFYYLLQDDTDIVTGRHLKRISEAVCQICAQRAKKPSAVMICITCVDALLGTDMDRVCRAASAEAGVPVVPCYMYALTREGRLPPMASVRDSVYSLLKKSEKRDSRAVNLLGYFSPIDPESDLFDFLRAAGIRSINQLSCCQTFDEYQHMAQANFNLVLNHEARYAAAGLEKRLGMPAIETARFYQPEKIARQYQLIAQAIGAQEQTASLIQHSLTNAQSALNDLKEKCGALTFAIGEWCNADPFELACALLTYGFKVAEIFGTIGQGNFAFLKKVAALSPNTKIYSNLEPSMIFYDGNNSEAQITIGRDAAYYHPAIPNTPWADEIQPFGFHAVTKLCQSLIR